MLVVRPSLSLAGDALAHATACLHGQGLAQLLLIEAIDGARRSLVDALRALAQEASMRRSVVVLIEKGPEPHVELVERGEGAGVIETAFAQRPPEALHLAAGSGIVGFGVQ